MNPIVEMARRVEEWDGKGAPPPPPPPPNRLEVSGLDLFGTAQRRVERLNMETTMKHAEAVALHRVLVNIKREARNEQR